MDHPRTEQKYMSIFARRIGSPDVFLKCSLTSPWYFLVFLGVLTAIGTCHPQLPWHKSIPVLDLEE